MACESRGMGGTTDFTEFKKRCVALNAEQREAVELPAGHALILAGPGSGKTETLALRIAYLLSRGVYPGAILCLTFTEAAAANMRRRLIGLVGVIAYRVPIHTFHGFCTDLIGRNPEYFYGSASFKPADDLARIAILDGIFKNLAHDNPLRAEHPAQGFVYLKTAQSVIRDLKKAGMTPQEFEQLLIANKGQYIPINEGLVIFNERLSASRISLIREYAESLKEFANSLGDSRHLSVATAVYNSLSHALDTADEDGKTAPLSAWKEQWTRKDDTGNRIFKDSAYAEKLYALCGIYKEYRAAMHAKALYDFDDMIVDVLEAFAKHAGFKATVAERYAHVLVDEFQDTNEAQMRILKTFLGDVMAVGDDDQAIYKFQGAEVANILDFKKCNPHARIIAFSSNYRSHDAIVEAAQSVALQGKNRLEGSGEILKKGSVAVRGAGGEILSKSFPTPLHEYAWVAEEIKRLINNGMNPRDIAVIAREHKQLEALQLFCAVNGVPVMYERLRDALHDPLVSELLVMAQFADSVARKSMAEADYLLPEILSFPFWGFERQTAWEISIAARGERGSWLSAMRHSADARVVSCADFLIEAGARAKNETADQVVDFLINGAFRAHYFSPERLRENSVAYALFLSGVAAFMRALRAYRYGEFIGTGDMLAFVALHQKNNIAIPDTSPFVVAGNAAHMATAHKIKGLEFDTVFVIGCVDSVWAGSERGSLLPFPINLPIAPSADSSDDHVRLLYVAMTRAKKNLYLTSYEATENGRSAERVRFLAGIPVVSASAECPRPEEILAAHLRPRSVTVCAGNERAFLESLLPQYQLSVTHLNTFLNVARGGPRQFLEQCLVRFPQAKSPSACYGSAMHAAVEALHARYTQSGSMPSATDLTGFFERALARERLTLHDATMYAARGAKALMVFYATKARSFKHDDIVEMNFKAEGVIVGNAHLTGKIDCIELVGGAGAVAYDLKTGKPSFGWEGRDLHEKIKLHGYRRQLLFYKLLIENSRTLGNRFMDVGVLNFLEPHTTQGIIDLSLAIDPAEIARLEKLIDVVWQKIQSLDFPDISHYPKNLSGIMAFEEDLLEGKV